jgi:hypothetical protein
MPGTMDFLDMRLKLFLFNDIFSVLFFMLIPDFKVRDILLTIIIHILNVKKKFPNILEKVVYNFLLIFFYLGGNKYGIPCGTAVTGILDMRPGKHDLLFFLVDVELLPHAVVNIPNETIHIGVFLYIFIIYFIFIIIILFLSYNSYNIYLFLVFFLF